MYSLPFRRYLDFLIWSSHSPPVFSGIEGYRRPSPIWEPSQVFWYRPTWYAKQLQLIPAHYLCLLSSDNIQMSRLLSQSPHRSHYVECRWAGSRNPYDKALLKDCWVQRSRKASQSHTEICLNDGGIARNRLTVITTLMLHTIGRLSSSLSVP